MKKLLIATCIVSAFIISCKKKDKDPAPTPNTTTTTTGGSTTGGSTTGGGGGNSAGTATNATTFNGIFTDIQTNYSGLGGSATLRTAEVYFSSTPVSDIDETTGINVNYVKLNGETLTYDSAGVYAPANPFSLDLTTQSWEINGANGIPTFTTNNGTAAPLGFNSAGIPASISKAAGVTIDLGTLANVKTGQLVLTDGSSSATGLVYLPLTNGNQKLTLTSSQLSGFAVSSGTLQGTLGVMLENTEARNISGKNFNFIKQVIVAKGLNITN